LVVVVLVFIFMPCYKLVLETQGSFIGCFNELFLSSACNWDDQCCLIGSDQDIHRRFPIVKVPKIYWNFTRQAVLTMEWIDGIKLTDAVGISEACLNRKQLIDEVLIWSILAYLCWNVSSLVLYGPVYKTWSYFYSLLARL